MNPSEKKDECLSSQDCIEFATMRHVGNGEADTTTNEEISKETLPHTSGNLDERRKDNHGSIMDQCYLNLFHTHSQSIGKKLDDAGIGQGEEIKEKDHPVSSSILQREEKTILEEIDDHAAAMHTGTDENGSKSFSSTGAEVKDGTFSVTSTSTNHNELHQDKENSSAMLNNLNVSPTYCHNQCDKSNMKKDPQKHQENITVAQTLKDVEDDCLSNSVKADPFSLSADEDFSPKTYKPIQRKVSLRQEKPTIALKRCSLSEHEDGIDQAVIIDAKEQLEGSEITLCSPEKKKLKPSHRVTYIYSAEMVEKTNRLHRIKGRANLVHSLIQVYGILQYIDVVEPRPATESEILGFHCADYISFLKGISDDDDDNSEAITDVAEEYGLSYDCPLQKDCFDIASLISGGTITAAESLCNDNADIAINWCGGWHHAKRDSASGFCYLNDIVLGILKLRERFDKVLYIDVDLHHGDGVEEAFYMTPKVMTVSFHKWAPGFFPGSGKLGDTGIGRGKYHSLNIPLTDGIKDNEFYLIFSKVMKMVRDKFQPEAVVMQCGADTLAEDPMLSFNMTHIAIAKCICFILTWNLPTLLLGGGGYHFANTARCWAFITAMAAGKKLPVDIPEHEHLPEYGPSYELTTSEGYRKNCNSPENIRQLLLNVQQNLNQIQV